jgi:guanylate kinase
MLFLLLGPSGIGKGTQIDLLRRRHSEFVFPKSVTTRKMRPQESQGNPYFFINDREFDEHIKNHDFLEWAKVHEAARYGTLRAPIEEALKAGKTVIKELDIQGLLSIKKTIQKPGFELIQKNLRSIFLMPPDEETLIERITKRSVIKEAELHARLESARKEIEQAHQCDQVINTTREDSIEEVYLKLTKAIDQSQLS